MIVILFNVALGLVSSRLVLQRQEMRSTLRPQILDKDEKAREGVRTLNCSFCSTSDKENKLVPGAN